MESFNLGDVVLDVLLHLAPASLVADQTLQHRSHLHTDCPSLESLSSSRLSTNQNEQISQFSSISVLNYPLYLLHLSLPQRIKQIPKDKSVEHLQHSSHHVQLGAARAGIPSRHLSQGNQNQDSRKPKSGDKRKRFLAQF